ncbi:M48 family metallopeptidase [Desulfogranum japonicum]|uniref:M48 family metallopeptidase n=1 Tax=Desulfogranum japonicum TaxID=231447 RepID=UPI00048F8E42|nr:M48 family metallopeptidase [Desulfogranum japonicum]
MIYNNLIYFLVVIFLFSTQSAPEKPNFSPGMTLLFFLGLILGYWALSKKVCSGAVKEGVNRYFSQEKKLSLLAVAVFAIMTFVLDIKYYLHPLSLQGKFPVLENLAGLVVFFCLLSIMWMNQKSMYEKVFGRHYVAGKYIFSNITANIPIVLPWLILSLLFDSLQLLPLPGVNTFLASTWGDLFLFLVFICVLVVFFPVLVKRVWGCTPIPDGPLREQVEGFLRQQNLHLDILYWPLFEGQALTAGIMGIVPPFRYLMITPALAKVLTPWELESVLAHEIGHVRKKHLLLYIGLFLGASLLINSLFEPLHYILLGSELLYTVCEWLNLSPANTLLSLITSMILVFLVVYFRYVFGFFIRNFERQADTFVFQAQQTAAPLIASFEKIASLSGNNRDEKNWHHFGIGERIDFLLRCEQDKKLIGRHDRKVGFSLLAYACCMVLLIGGLHSIDTDQLRKGNELRFYEELYGYNMRKDPGNSRLAIEMADLYMGRQLEKKAIAAYERALILQPTNPHVNNNLAYLLLTAENRELRDAARALTLARSAALIDKSGFVLDTLATAFWANGLVEEAVFTERKAMQVDGHNRNYYKTKLDLFLHKKWEEVETFP